MYGREGGIYPYRCISSLRTLTGLGQRSWVAVVVLRPWTVPPPLGIIKITKYNNIYQIYLGIDISDYLFHRYAQNREATLFRSFRKRSNSKQIDYLIYSLPPIP